LSCRPHRRSQGRVNIYVSCERSPICIFLAFAFHCRTLNNGQAAIPTCTERWVSQFGSLLAQCISISKQESVIRSTNQKMQRASCCIAEKRSGESECLSRGQNLQRVFRLASRKMGLFSSFAFAARPFIFDFVIFSIVSSSLSNLDFHYSVDLPFCPLFMVYSMRSDGNHTMAWYGDLVRWDADGRIVCCDVRYARIDFYSQQ